MQTYEYKVGGLSFKDLKEAEGILSRLGEAGWQLVAQRKETLIFMRPRQPIMNADQTAELESRALV
jgi:hypothetical protein